MDDNRKHYEVNHFEWLELLQLEKKGVNGMKRSLINMAIFSIVAFFNGCAVTDQKVSLHPILDVESENVGNNKQVGVQVLDERSEQHLGFRSTAESSKGAVITTDQEVAEVFGEKIREGLKMKGFEPTSYSDDLSRTLKIEIHGLKNYTSDGFWTGDVRTNASLTAVARRSGEQYERSYRTESEERIILVPLTEDNEQSINATISEVLQITFDDRKLIEFLGK